MRSLKNPISYEKDAWSKLRETFHEENTPHEIAASFSLGLFITALPSAGFGFAIFGFIWMIWDGSSKMAFLASAAVLNPVIKPLFYAASLGTAMFLYTGKKQLTAASSLMAFGTGVVLVGGVLSVLSYFLVLETVERYRGDQIVLLKEVEKILAYAKTYF